jgi:phage terminase Nu1 subunit (DNA packaging protein)
VVVVVKSFSKHALAKALQKPVKVIDDWIHAGCPHEKNIRGHYQFDLADVWQWREDFIRRSLTTKSTKDAGGAEYLDLSAERARLAKEQADKLEMENAESRGETLNAECVRIIIQGMFGTVRNRVLGIPTKVAPFIIGKSEIGEIQTILNDEIYECLTELSEMKIEGTLAESAD